MTEVARPDELDMRLPWSTRIVMMFSALVVGSFAFADSVANVLARTAPIQAHLIAPWNGAISARAAQFAFVAKPSASSNSAPALLARRALKDNATATDALNVLGLQAQLRGDSAEASRIFSYSLRLSRREFQARLWAIEDGVRRGDITGILTNYDLALRTSKDAPTILFPVLTSSLAEPEVRRRLHAVLAQNPVWLPSFLNYAPRNTFNPEVVAQLFLEGERYGLAATAADKAFVVNGLANKGEIYQAWTFYRRMHPKASRDRSRDDRFENSAAEVSIFDWNPVTSDGGAVSIGATGGGADFSAPASVGGLLLRQTQLLPQGRYVLEGVSEGVEQPEATLPYFAVECRGDRQLLRVAVVPSLDRPRSFGGAFTVPGDCPVQTLSFVIRPSDDIRGVEGRILRVGIRPATPVAKSAS